MKMVEVTQLWKLMWSWQCVHVKRCQAFAAGDAFVTTEVVFAADGRAGDLDILSKH